MLASICLKVDDRIHDRPVVLLLRASRSALVRQLVVYLRDFRCDMHFASFLPYFRHMSRIRTSPHKRETTRVCGYRACSLNQVIDPRPRLTGRCISLLLTPPFGDLCILMSRAHLNIHVTCIKIIAERFRRQIIISSQQF